MNRHITALAHHLRPKVAAAAILLFAGIVRPVMSQDTMVADSTAGSSAPTVNAFYKFVFDGIGSSGYSHGKVLNAELVQGADGGFYGVTTYGGPGLCADGFGVEGCGTIFKITPGGVQTVIYNFTYDSTTNAAVNGIYPYGGLVQGKDGNFYGTAAAGGDPHAGGNGCILGCGTIFKITPAGKLTVLHRFAGVNANPPEGANPLGRLIQASDGKFYGTTHSGGAVQGFFNQGTVFSITASGAYATLHQFDDVHGTVDGAGPYAGLVQGKDGNFYGTTYFGGTDNSGTIYRITKSGVVTILHSFVQPQHNVFPEGGFPEAALLLASDGNFYGATTVGGNLAGSFGTLFKITPQGTFNKIFEFNPNTSVSGWHPMAGLTQASDGNLYGTTVWNGAGEGSGSVYKLTPGGAVIEIAALNDAITGRWPVSVPLQAADGTLFVNTVVGASLTAHDGGGEILQIDNGLPVPSPTILKFSPKSGRLGQRVTIAGTHFVGTTAVRFHGTAAAFAVKSPTTLVASVPSGATTGQVTVTNAGGSVTSAGSFTVLP